MKWILRQLVLIALDDPKTRKALIEAVNPDYWWDLKYGDRKNPPPKVSFVNLEKMRWANNGDY